MDFVVFCIYFRKLHSHCPICWTFFTNKKDVGVGWGGLGFSYFLKEETFVLCRDPRVTLHGGRGGAVGEMWRRSVLRAFQTGFLRTLLFDHCCFLVARPSGMRRALIRRTALQGSRRACGTPYKSLHATQSAAFLTLLLKGAIGHFPGKNWMDHFIFKMLWIYLF